MSFSTNWLHEVDLFFLKKLVCDYFLNIFAAQKK